MAPESNAFPRRGAKAITTAPHLSAPEHEWTVLVIGKGAPGPALVEELERLGQDVDEAEADSASTAVTVSAPDLVVLVGDAASDRGEFVLGALAEGAHGAVAPVMVIGDSARAQVHPNYRHGRVAALSNKLPVPILAKRVLELTSDLPDRTGEQTGRVTGEQLETLVEGLTKDKRSGTLDVTPEASKQRESLVMAGGQAVSEPSGAFVARVQPKLGAPGSFRFKERSGGHTDSVAPAPPAAGQAAVRTPRKEAVTIARPPPLRIVVVDADLARAEALAQALRDRRMMADAIDGDVSRLDAVAHSDAQIVLTTPAHLRTTCRDVMAAIEAHPRLRWASTLLAPPGLLWPAGGGDPDLDVLQRKLDKLTEPDNALIAQTRAGGFETRLEVIGPGRMLRAIARCPAPRRVVVRHPRVKIAITLEGGRVVQATAKPKEGELSEGSPALAALLSIRSGRVEVSPVKAAITLASAREVGEAIDRAAKVESPIAHSVPPPSTTAAGASPPPPAASPPSAVAREQPAPAPTPLLTGEFDLAAAAEADRNDPMVAPPPPPAGLAEFSDFGAPTSDPDGSGVIELASAPLPLSAVLNSGRLGTGAGVDGATPAGIDQPAVPVDDDPIEIPGLGGRSTLANALEAATAVASAGAARVRGSLSRLDVEALTAQARGGLPKPNLSALKTRAAPLLARAKALPPAARYGGATAIVALLALALWPGAPATVDGRAEAAASMATAAAPVADAPPPTAAEATAAPAAAPAPPEPAAEPAAQEAEPAETAEPAAALAAQEAEPAEAAELAAEPTAEEAEPAAAAEVDPGPVEEDAAAEGPAPGAAVGEEAERRARIEKAQKLQRTATGLRRQGRLGPAESTYLEALGQWPRYPLAIAGLVRLYLARKDGSKALRWAKKLVRIQPNRGNNQLLLGDAYMLHRKTAAAKKAYLQSARYGNRTAKKRLAAL